MSSKIPGVLRDLAHVYPSCSEGTIVIIITTYE